MFKLQVCPKRVCISTVGVRKDLYNRDPNKVPITDFFGSIRPTEISTGRVNITLADEEYAFFAFRFCFSLFVLTF